MVIPLKNAICNTCTIMLVQKAYERAWWFRLIREPLRMCMIAMGVLLGIQPEEYVTRSERCKGCVRFLKTALKEKSPAFMRLNERINPLFDRLIERLVTKDELDESKRHAREMTSLQ